ncbi:MAG: heme ABC transporter ATP-binding protein [Enterobacteriaceae bacterium]
MALLSLQNVGLMRGQRSVLQQITLQLEPGTLAVLIGGNGAGKSSLFHCIGGELGFTGCIRLFDRPQQQWQPDKLATRMALLPQSSSLGFDFLCEEVVQLGRLPHGTGRQRDKEIVARCLQQVDAVHLARRPYTTLSGGERQRVHLARVLAQLCQEPGHEQATLLLLDEPTSALDLQHQHQLLQQVRHYVQQGHAALLILHDINLAAQYADQILLLHQGSLLAQGTPASVLTPDNLHQVFAMNMMVIQHPAKGVVQVLAC